MEYSEKFEFETFTSASKIDSRNDPKIINLSHSIVSKQIIPGVSKKQTIRDANKIWECMMFHHIFLTRPKKRLKFLQCELEQHCTCSRAKINAVGE